MNKTSELVGILSKYFKWNKARLNCFTQILVSLFIVRTVNLSEVALAMDSAAQVSSRYKQIQRFFKGFTFNYDEIAHWIFQLFHLKNHRFYLAIDRTNWCWGKQGINLFVLSVIWGNVAIPLFLLYCQKKEPHHLKNKKRLLHVLFVFLKKIIFWV